MQNVEVESTLTDRYQTTVPETVRLALRLRKRDKIHYRVLASGEVMMSRVASPEDDDPVLGQFLDFLARDILHHPEHLRALDGAFVERLQALTEAVEIDLDAALPAEDE